MSILIGLKATTDTSEIGIVTTLTIIPLKTILGNRIFLASGPFPLLAYNKLPTTVGYEI